MKRTYKSPGKKWLTVNETLKYIELFESYDWESFQLGIDMFKQTPTYKHYKYSPINKGKYLKLYDFILYLEYERENRILKDLFYGDYIDALKRWIYHHTIGI